MIGEDITLAEARPGDVLHPPHGEPGTGELHRSLDWKGAFWASSGVPAGVLLTMGALPPPSASQAGWCGSPRS
jgi:hypothetical protein